MRRSEFEVKDLQEIRAILQHCQVCRLALCDGGQPYLVPLSYGMHFDEAGNLVTLYFHSAQEGKKLSFLSVNPQVCFEMDDYVQIIPAAQACGFSMRYASIIGNGRAKLIEDLNEKQVALASLMAHYAPDQPWQFPLPALEKTCIFSVAVKSLSFKKRI